MLDRCPMAFARRGCRHSLVEKGLAESVLELKPQPRGLDLPKIKARQCGRENQSQVMFVFTLVSWLHLSVYTALKISKHLTVSAVASTS